MCILHCYVCQTPVSHISYVCVNAEQEDFWIKHFSLFMLRDSDYSEYSKTTYFPTSSKLYHYVCLLHSERYICQSTAWKIMVTTVSQYLSKGLFINWFLRGTSYPINCIVVWKVSNEVSSAAATPFDMTIFISTHWETLIM